MKACIGDDVMEAVAALASREVVRIERIEGGLNNTVARVDTTAGPLLAKIYFPDDRDRLGAEFGMLSFLWRHGVRSIPEPLAADRGRRIGLYEFVEGRRFVPAEVGEREVDQLVQLLADMAKLISAPGAERLGEASDSAFSLAGHVDKVRSRLGRFLTAAGVHPDAGSFARSEVVPLLDEACALIESGARRLGGDPRSELPRGERVLSPADHGFHNALRRPDGSLVFLDFEYAGWDDPAQMIGNACWQPAVPIPETLRPRFVDGVLASLGSGVRERLDLLFPLLGLKWSLILLNEFLPDEGRRRAFAGRRPEAVRAAQLDKAREYAGRVRAALSAGAR